MWLFTRFGFYSVTVSRVDRTKIQIRARSRQDLERLARFAAEKASLQLGEIIVTPHSDYHYRLICSRPEWTNLAALLAEDIDYSNFKNQIHDSQRHQLYLEVWRIMEKLQSQQAPD